MKSNFVSVSGVQAIDPAAIIGLKSRWMLWDGFCGFDHHDAAGDAPYRSESHVDVMMRGGRTLHIPTGRWPEEALPQLLSLYLQAKTLGNMLIKVSDSTDAAFVDPLAFEDILTYSCDRPGETLHGLTLMHAQSLHLCRHAGMDLRFHEREARDMTLQSILAERPGLARIGALVQERPVRLMADPADGELYIDTAHVKAAYVTPFLNASTGVARGEGVDLRILYAKNRAASATFDDPDAARTCLANIAGKCPQLHVIDPQACLFADPRQISDVQWTHDCKAFYILGGRDNGSMVEIYYPSPDAARDAALQSAIHVRELRVPRPAIAAPARREPAVA